nr:MAG TPA: hypothetical protein [Caudoviricetes sp.]
MIYSELSFFSWEWHEKKERREKIREIKKYYRMGKCHFISLIFSRDRVESALS